MKKTKTELAKVIANMLHKFKNVFKGDGYELKLSNGTVFVTFGEVFYDQKRDIEIWFTNENETKDILDCSYNILASIYEDVSFQFKVLEFENVEDDELENIEVRTASELPDILREMADYLEGCADNGERLNGYFQEIISTGAFHDACGKELDRRYGVVMVTTCY